MITVGKGPRFVTSVMDVRGTCRHKIFAEGLFTGSRRRQVCCAYALEFIRVQFCYSGCPANRILLIRRRTSMGFQVERFFAGVAYRGSIFRVIILREQILLCTTRTTIVVNGRRPVPKRRRSKAGTSRTSCHVLRQQTFHVM